MLLKPFSLSYSKRNRKGFTNRKARVDRRSVQPSASPASEDFPVVILNCHVCRICLLQGLANYVQDVSIVVKNLDANVTVDILEHSDVQKLLASPDADVRSHVYVVSELEVYDLKLCDEFRVILRNPIPVGIGRVVERLCRVRLSVSVVLQDAIARGKSNICFGVSVARNCLRRYVGSVIPSLGLVVPPLDFVLGEVRSSFN